MKIGFTSIDLTEGKVKYNDEKLIALEKKDKPKKVSPYFAEFIRDEFVRVETIVIPGEKILDLLILDMEKIETRLTKVTDEAEKQGMRKSLEALEKEIPLSDLELDGQERTLLSNAAVYSSLPVVQIKGDEDVNALISLALDKAGYMFFYTSGPAESHAWLVKKGSEIIDCAAKIHSDLARGFIKGDVVGFDDYMSCHNFNDCKSKGLARLVDRDYIVAPNEVIEIRFNV